MAQCYKRGAGVLRHVSGAVKWYGKAADLGSLSAKARLGHQYATGLGVERDLKVAERWLWVACLGRSRRQGWMQRFSLLLCPP